MTGFHVYLYVCFLYVCSFYCSGEDRSYFYMYIVANFCKYFILFIIVLCKTRVLCKYSSLEMGLFGVFIQRFMHFLNDLCILTQIMLMNIEFGSF